MKNIIIGTAGHIDHGKTTLIKALTGNDTDTLKEEKKRGISINLGFTYFDLPNGKKAGIVDVPGHEKFIKNMLAGASSVDMVLLVISAEEGVMPQTIEHIDILSYLNVKNGIIVLTKCDKVEKDFIEIVKEDIKSKIQNTFIEKAKIIEVDSISKNGFTELIKEIEYLSELIEAKNINLPVRLNIDRVFSAKGFGTVVTGTLLEGSINLDDEVFIYPQNTKAKIRSIQVHGENVDTAYAGQRTAINISNIGVDEIKRGDVLASKDSVTQSMMIDVKLSLVSHTDKILKHWDRIKLYHGTREILCRVVPLDKDFIKKGESGYCQLRLEESITAKKKDPFVIRTYSPTQTIGGGIIIDIESKKHKRFDDSVIISLKNKEKGDLDIIIEEYLIKNSFSYPTLKDILLYTGDNEENVIKNIEILINTKKILKLNSSYIHLDYYENLKQKIITILNDFHKKNRLKEGILKEELKNKIDKNIKSKDSEVLLEILQNESIIKIQWNFISIFDFEVKLNNKQKELEKLILKKVETLGVCSIPSMKELSESKNHEEVLGYMIGKTLEKLDDTYILDKNTYEKLKLQIIDYLNKNKEITISDYRELIRASRKNCVIILENFDRNKITKREDNKRVLY